MSKIEQNHSDDKRIYLSNFIHEVSIFLISLVIIVFTLLVLTDSPIIKIKSVKMHSDQSLNTSTGVDRKNVALFNQ